MRTNYCGLIDKQYLGQTVTLFGWAHRRRDHGGVIFIDLRDREGLVQVVIDPDTPAAFQTADRTRSEFVLMIVGKVRPRPEGTTNSNLKSGEIEVLASEVEVLNAALTPPFMIDDENVNEETRLKYRYIDLRRATMQKKYSPAVPRGDGSPPVLGRARLYRYRNAILVQIHAGRSA